MVGIRQNQKSNTIRKYHHAKFLICNSCLRCASYLSSYDAQNCPSCNSDKVELIPISETEAYRLHMDRDNVSMEFWNLRK
jgi:hypothetical protein